MIKRKEKKDQIKSTTVPKMGEESSRITQAIDSFRLASVNKAKPSLNFSKIRNLG
jgi:hypothetical protein